MDSAPGPPSGGGGARAASRSPTSTPTNAALAAPSSAASTSATPATPATRPQPPQPAPLPWTSFAGSPGAGALASASLSARRRSSGPSRMPYSRASTLSLLSAVSVSDGDEDFDDADGEGDGEGEGDDEASSDAAAVAPASAPARARAPFPSDAARHRYPAPGLAGEARTPSSRRRPPRHGPVPGPASGSRFAPHTPSRLSGSLISPSTSPPPGPGPAAAAGLPYRAAYTAYGASTASDASDPGVAAAAMGAGAGAAPSPFKLAATTALAPQKRSAHPSSSEDSPASTPSRHLARSFSQQDLQLDAAESEAAKHALLAKAALQRWDSADYMAADSRVRRSLSPRTRDEAFDASPRRALQPKPSCLRMELDADEAWLPAAPVHPADVPLQQRASRDEPHSAPRSRRSSSLSAAPQRGHGLGSGGGGLDGGGGLGLPKTYSLQDLLVESSPTVSEVAKHQMRRLHTRWDSGEFFASPAGVRERLDSNEEDPFHAPVTPSTPSAVAPAGAPWPRRNSSFESFSGVDWARRVPHAHAAHAAHAAADARDSARAGGERGDHDSGTHPHPHLRPLRPLMSMEDVLVSERAPEPAKHAVLDKPVHRRWDSGEWFASPPQVRDKLATNAESVFGGVSLSLPGTPLSAGSANYKDAFRRRRSSLGSVDTFASAVDVASAAVPGAGPGARAATMAAPRDGAPAAQPGRLKSVMSAQDLAAAGSPSEVARHAVLKDAATPRRLQHWHSGDYYAAPPEVRERIPSNEDDPFASPVSLAASRRSLASWEARDGAGQPGSGAAAAGGGGGGVDDADSVTGFSVGESASPTLRGARRERRGSAADRPSTEPLTPRSLGAARGRGIVARAAAGGGGTRALAAPPPHPASLLVRAGHDFSVRRPSSSLSVEQVAQAAGDDAAEEDVEEEETLDGRGAGGSASVGWSSEPAEEPPRHQARPGGLVVGREEEPQSVGGAVDAAAVAGRGSSFPATPPRAP